MAFFSDLSGDAVRDAIDARERYRLLRQALAELRHSYGGSMKFEARGDADYLIRRPFRGTGRRSCGRRSPETENMLRKFEEGKAAAEERVQSLRKLLEEQAPVLRARGLGRVPLLTARVIRKFEDLGWLGRTLLVLGTNALYAYEAAAAVRIEAGMLATGDVDVLYDARRKLVMSGEVGERGLIGALQSVDRSFQPVGRRSYTAANKDGYMVDLLEPLDYDRVMRQGPARMSAAPDDLVAVSTESSRWLLNVPKFSATTFDEKGLPVRIVTIDPRAFALQKQWILENDPTRDPAKRRRDGEQARLVAKLAVRHLGLSFNDSALSALPRSFLDLADRLEVPPIDEAPLW
ncbi:hypothetical protein GQF56_21365 [Rhodobacter sphaeroides]|jgi:Uncharacterized conserved protein|uniref:Nucleotidyltransferase-like domain-containing protein n=2 Tax=Cereibacter sphaeroides TaxID=1063 RepID=Q3IV36_CERS4|nr:nucleotidyltransferase domain-containing protein [Cereibacter sphaeroides]ABA81598.1 hypothetical protein RSP_4124 [Cereibacter sphaeroides 2.4.1]AMJ50093.1 hypothetical protein APX01_21300 [Cereibacter sphaeroides]ANS36714.1 hypothetical protein A3858_20845 [Cereibacter sphaeroides]ATN65864.1 hypothetical protein A3857_21315 [Cereibacter sphaeroides]AXC64028.1 hypothetical protein DQL45_21845 [Cereibacter sphaeroides 2.4.1]